MFGNCDQKEDVRPKQDEEGAHGDETTVGSDQKLQSVCVHICKFDEPRKVTIKAIHFVGTAKG